MKVIIVIVSIIAIPLIVALFMKKDYAVEREIIINKPKQEVFGYIKLLKNQDYYSKWVLMDPKSKKDYKGTDGTVGFVSLWDSEVVGKGEQEIKNLVEGERMDLDLHFIKPFEGKATSYFTTTATSDNQTKVKWGFNGTMKYPMNLMLIFMQKKLGDDFSAGLTNLKGVLEKQS